MYKCHLLFFIAIIDGFTKKPHLKKKSKIYQLMSVIPPEASTRTSMVVLIT